MRVLVENRHSESGLSRGLTDNYLEVRFSAPQSEVGKLCWVRIDEFRPEGLFGELTLPAENSIPLLSR